jgi:hypothetical protein
MARVPHRRRGVQTNTPTDDAVPEPRAEPCLTKKTLELCGHEHSRMRCARTKGHDGQHEALSLDGPNQWR